MGRHHREQPLCHGEERRATSFVVILENKQLASKKYAARRLSQAHRAATFSRNRIFDQNAAPLVRLQPVVPGSHLHLHRHAQGQRFGHFLNHQIAHRFYFRIGHIQHQLIVYLKHHLGLPFLLV